MTCSDLSAAINHSMLHTSQEYNPRQIVHLVLFHQIQRQSAHLLCPSGIFAWKHVLDAQLLAKLLDGVAIHGYLRLRISMHAEAEARALVS